VTNDPEHTRSDAVTAALLCLVGLGLPDVDRSVFEDIRHGWRDPGLRLALGLVTEAGGPVAQAGLGGVLYLRGNESQQRAARLAGVAWVSSLAVMTGIRAVVRRPRPETDSTPWWDSSFPSGHATSYFAATTVYTRKWPELAPFVAVGGLLMCLSRVHLGEHYPSDVIAGAALGYAGGMAALALEKRLEPVLDRMLPVGRFALAPGPGRLGLACGI